MKGESFEFSITKSYCKNNYHILDYKFTKYTIQNQKEINH